MNDSNNVNDSHLRINKKLTLKICLTDNDKNIAMQLDRFKPYRIPMASSHVLIQVSCEFPAWDDAKDSSPSQTFLACSIIHPDFPKVFKSQSSLLTSSLHACCQLKQPNHHHYLGHKLLLLQPSTLGNHLHCKLPQCCNYAEPFQPVCFYL